MRRTDDLSTPRTGHPYLGDMTRDEFHEGLEVAHWLHSPGPQTRRRAIKDLLSMGPRAVRLAAYTIEEVICIPSATDYDLDRQADIAAAIVRRMGRAAVPVLDDLATNASASPYVNKWAQGLIFVVLGLEGDARGRACHHGTRLKVRKGGREVWACAFCDALFGGREHPTEGITPAGRPRAVNKSALRAARR
jgi:hypothetical protein